MQTPLVASAEATSLRVGADVATDAVQFAIIGDYGEDGPDEMAVCRLVHSWQPEFIVTLGDNNYPDGAADTIDDNIGKYYGDYIAFNPNYRGRFAQQGAKENRFFPALGNHDWHTRDLQPYLSMFDLPGNGRYYAFRRGPVEFFILDSDRHEPDGTQPDSTQGRWLQAGLAASSAPFRIVVMHHPPYTSAPRGNYVWMQWPFKKWGASVVLAGHEHLYERVEIDGFAYLINGAGGSTIKYKSTIKPSVHGTTANLVYDQAPGALHVHADRHRLTFDFITVDNERIDTLTLTH